MDYKLSSLEVSNNSGIKIIEHTNGLHPYPVICQKEKIICAFKVILLFFEDNYPDLSDLDYENTKQYLLDNFTLFIDLEDNQYPLY